VCAILPLLVQVMTSPTRALSELGVKVLSPTLIEIFLPWALATDFAALALAAFAALDVAAFLGVGLFGATTVPASAGETVIVPTMSGW
jgi:hypothetical protein